MIISIHQVKAAGHSLQEALKQEFKERLLLDYNDWLGYRSAESDARAAASLVEMRARRDDLQKSFDVIHGHFIADKYVGMFSNVEFLAFFRDPFQQAVSQYQYLRRIPHVREHPAVRILHDSRMTLEDFIVWEPTKNPQTQGVGDVALEEFAMIGLVEEFPRSIDLFQATFGRRLSSEIFANANAARPEGGYAISADLKKLIEVHRAEDIELYRRAKEMFSLQALSRGI